MKTKKVQKECKPKGEALNKPPDYIDAYMIGDVCPNVALSFIGWRMDVVSIVNW